MWQSHACYMGGSVGPAMVPLVGLGDPPHWILWFSSYVSRSQLQMQSTLTLGPLPTSEQPE